MNPGYRPHWWMIGLTAMVMIVVQRWLWDADEIWRLMAAGGLPFVAIKLDMYIWRKEHDSPTRRNSRRAAPAQPREPKPSSAVRG